MSLPANLKPWMEWLQHFDQQLAQLLGQLLLQIEPLFPQPKAQPMASDNEFDGFNGIINRGHYHRLLASEWVLADDMPDEFMRRAVEYEHHFLAPQLKEPRNDGNCLVIFDAGVHQLGSLRIFHVAMWILLAQRALQRGAEFRWAIAQQPDKVHTESTVDALKTLLNARTLSVVTTDIQQQWLDYLADKNNQVAEQWWVGCSEAVTPLPARLCPNRVSLQSLILTQQVHIELATRAVFRQLRVVEPQGKPFNKLLKGQFNSQPVRVGYEEPEEVNQDSLLIPQQSLYISPCSSYVALILRNHTVRVWRIPQRSETRMKLLADNQFASAKNGRFIAATFNGKQLGGLFSSEYGLRGWLLPALGYAESEYDLVRQHGLLRKMPAVLCRSYDYDGLYVLDDAHMLVQWKKDRAEQAFPPRQMLIANQVLALQPAKAEQVVYAQQYGQQEIRIVRTRMMSNGGNEGIELQRVGLSRPVSRFLMCVNISWFRDGDNAWAYYVQNDHAWYLGASFFQHTVCIQLNKEHRVLALLHDPFTVEPREVYGRLALLVLAANRRSIMLVYDNTERVVLVESGNDIMHVDISGHYLVWVSMEHTLHVLDLSTRKVHSHVDIRG